ncbi:MAG: fibrobacter succinogenes major paralogous domain-containing protein [Fibromonadaceae bacterium]|jgi:uncharacterized protein (TIGR02145 family)|nr:fibrobacter succinogenes major paralogous domain-containing protein [Fibromonadaceae bacterium]
MRTQHNGRVSLPIALTAALALAIIFTFSCSSKDGDEGGGSGGSCDIKDYKTKKIGEQVWMAENLNCNVSGSKCYDNKPANCNKYGRLYDCETAMTVCPSGWHLPSNVEWEELIDYVESSKGCTDCSGKYLKAKSGWNDGGNGTDEFGFSAMPSGHGVSSDYFYDVRDEAYWWGSSESNSSYTNYRYIDYRHDGHVNSFSFDKSLLYSVRCLED